MNIPGRVHNGVVVMDGGPTLPEGQAVTVFCPALPAQSKPRRRVELPLVRTGRPGSVDLTSQCIAEILDDEDAAPGR